MRILVAPDSFKDSLSSSDICFHVYAALAEQRDLRIDGCALGDGGEGTARILAGALRCDLISETVLDPLGRERNANWYHRIEPNDHGVVEMADASGLMLLDDAERDPLRTTSYGTGQLLKAACARGCKTIQLCVGGSATVDGGIGCLQALGWTFWDQQQNRFERPLCGGDLPSLGGFAAPLDLPEAEIEILCDVRNPLLGPDGAAPVFGPQKGAGAEQVAQLQAGLTHWSALLAAQTGWDVSDLPASGAAGGIVAGLRAALEAKTRPGFDAVADAVDLDERIRRCDWVLTGEGRLDSQSMHGKVVGSLLERTRALGKPLAVIAGTCLERPDGLAALEVLSPEGPTPEALAETPTRLATAVVRLVETMRSTQS